MSTVVLLSSNNQFESIQVIQIVGRFLEKASVLLVLGWGLGYVLWVILGPVAGFAGLLITYLAGVFILRKFFQSFPRS